MSNSKRKCAFCKTRLPASEMYITGIQAFCNKEHWIEYQVKNKDRLVKKGRKIQKSELRKRKEELRPRSWYLREAQKWFNKFIRLRDKGLPCISCDKPDDGSYQRHASHYRSVGACSSLRFDENNVHASCSKCNNWLSGNISGYTQRLIEKIGVDEFKRIDTAPKLKQWDIDELKEIITIYKFKCSELQ